MLLCCVVFVIFFVFLGSFLVVVEIFLCLECLECCGDFLVSEW